MADCAAVTLELQRAVISYLPLEFFKYGKCAKLAQDGLAAFDKPMRPTRIGAMLLKRSLKAQDFMLL